MLDARVVFECFMNMLDTCVGLFVDGDVDEVNNDYENETNTAINLQTLQTTMINMCAAVLVAEDELDGEFGAPPAAAKHHFCCFVMNLIESKSLFPPPNLTHFVMEHNISSR